MMKGLSCLKKITGLNDTLLLLGRLLLAALFLWDGIYKCIEFPAAVQFFKNGGMSGAAAHTVVILSIITELLFSLFLIIGWWVRPSALILALYTICVISSFSDFSVAWPELGAVVVEFLKGLAIVGGLFHVAGSGSGWFGCDFLVHKKKA